MVLVMKDSPVNIPWAHHTDMVDALYKRMGSLGGDLMHAAVGLLGEVVELFAATDRANVIEECGDCEFYLTHAWLVLSKNKAALRYSTAARRSRYADALPELLVCAGNFHDIAKKMWVYNKEVGAGEIMVSLQYVEERLLNFYDHNSLDRDLIRLDNMVKLARRYPTGYTDQAAQHRADKEASHG